MSSATLFYLMHKNEKIGELKGYINYDGFKIYDVYMYHESTLKTSEMNRYLISRTIPADRWPVKTLLALMQVPSHKSIDRHYGIYYTFAIMNYCASLTDGLWLNPAEDFRIEFQLSQYEQECTSFRGQTLYPAEKYEDISFWKTKTPRNVSKILRADYYKPYWFSRVNYRAPDFTTRCTTYSAWIQKESFDYWLSHIIPYDKETTEKKIQDQKEEFALLQQRGIIVPEIEPYMYGFCTSCLASENASCISTDQLQIMFAERNREKAEKTFAERLQVPIVGEYLERENTGLLYDGKTLRRVAWQNPKLF